MCHSMLLLMVVCRRRLCLLAPTFNPLVSRYISTCTACPSIVHAISNAVFRTVLDSTRPEDNLAHNSAHDSLALYCEKFLDILLCNHL